MAYIEVDMPLNNYCYHSLGIKIGGAVWRICSIPFNLPPKVHFCNKLSADMLKCLAVTLSAFRSRKLVAFLQYEYIYINE